MDWQNIFFVASTWACPVLIAVTFHEAAHGWIANLLGDDTAKRFGRVTFNPFKHIDLFGTIFLPALLLLGSGGRLMFGFAKPVPVNYGNLRNPKQDMIWVALAGPASNLLLAFVSVLVLHLFSSTAYVIGDWFMLNLFNSIKINILLFVFNLLPIPPLDGGRILAGLLPLSCQDYFIKLEKMGFLIIISGFFFLPLIGEFLGIPINLFWWLVGEPSEFIMRKIFNVPFN